MLMAVTVEESSTIRRLTGVQERLKEQQESLQDLQQLQTGPAHPTKVERVKYLTREIQNAIKKTKAWNRGQLDGLERNQNTIEEELEILERTFSKAKIEQEVAEREAERKEDEALLSKEDVAGLEKEAVPVFQEDFHSWISRAGGHNGGWTQDDHLLMTTLTHRHANWRKKTERFIEEVWAGVKAVPSKEAVRKHVDWYSEYCARRDQQKQRIGDWRKIKMEKKEAQSKKKSGSVQKLHKVTKGDWLQKNKEKLKRLEEWKKLKNVRKEIEEAEELLRVAEKKSKIERRMERRNEQIKHYLKAREEKKRLQLAKEVEVKKLREMERKQRREVNRLVLSQYHDKDMERIQAKIKQKSEEASRRDEERRQQLERLTRPVLARREQDSSVTRPTAATAARAKDRISLVFSAGAGPGLQRGKSDLGPRAGRRRSVDGGDIYHLDNLPRLASPQWRSLV